MTDLRPRGELVPDPIPAPVPRVARQLALAHLLERVIDEGLVADHAALARTLGVSRARVSQLASLLNLCPEVQGRVLSGEIRTTARELRAVAAEASWHDQLRQIEGAP